ncbi:response regulator [Flavobacterium cerinum]|uniref:Response regulator n=1 Tax=Flavobacterium cerinum TaxID=2502784 RepID=A0A444HB68_9FLAO|nr:response regulator [Flavobacterium cerinum]RWX00571.1 response regulator [Flavobacterium cerinum]
MERKIKIFMIDDDPDDREFFQIALDMTGIRYTLKTAESAVEALNIFPEFLELPDYIFLDLNMPLISGIQFLQIFRESADLNKVPIIIFSTSSYHKDIEDTKALGASHFLSKTSDIDRLSEVVVSILKGNDLPFILT